MTDESTRDRSPEPDDAGQEQVARLLAAAAAEERLPDDVAARLDAVLGDLVSEREDAGAGTTPGHVSPSEDAAPGTVRPATSLAAHRRRRWPGLLVAAATVSVLGLGLGNLLAGQGGAGDAVTADSSAGGGAESAEDPGVAALRDDDGAPEAEAPSTDTTSVWPPRLRTASLADDVARVVEEVPVERRVVTGEEEAAGWCVRPTLSPGDEALPVRLDGSPAVLVLREPVGGRRTAEVFGCDDADNPTASTTVPAG